MNFYDMTLLGLANLQRTKLRTFLTVLGVVIGIGALTSMVSFGTGMQKNITDAFIKNDMFTSIVVTPKMPDFNEIASGDTRKPAGASRGESKPLTDSVLSAIRSIKGVQLAYPNLEFPARIALTDDSASLTITAVPAAVGSFKPYSELLAGSFFAGDSDLIMILREDILLSKLNIRLIKNGKHPTLSHTDSIRGVKLMHPDSLIGNSISLITMSVNPSGIASSIFGMMSGRNGLPIGETVSELKIGGILQQKGQFFPGMSGGQVIIPIATAESIPRLGFTSIWDLLDDKKKAGTYGSIHVRIDDMKSMDSVKEELESLQVGVFSIADQLHEIRRSFLIINSILGVIGAIALMVAGLGIINTMVMSILERTREIGIMKAIGGSETEIRMIFFVEAAVIGLIGALFGLVLGWIVTRIANLMMNMQIASDGVEPVNLFYFPMWLILGAIAFSILISLAAGLYPAMRAARIDPVKALRHD